MTQLYEWYMLRRVMDTSCFFTVDGETSRPFSLSCFLMYSVVCVVKAGGM